MKNKFCINCKHFDNSDAPVCTRNVVYDLVFGKVVSGETYPAIEERYPNSGYLEKVYSVSSDYTGPCDLEGGFFVYKGDVNA